MCLTTPLHMELSCRRATQFNTPPAMDETLVHYCLSLQGTYEATSLRNEYIAYSDEKCMFTGPVSQIPTATFFCFSSCGKAKQTYIL